MAVLVEKVYLNPLEVAGLHELEFLYAFRRREEVLNFLGLNPFLMPVLVEAQAELKTYFPNAELYLEMFTDRETIEGDHLIIFIATDLRGTEALKILDRFDDTWWINNIDRVGGKISINLEYYLPGSRVCRKERTTM